MVGHFTRSKDKKSHLVVAVDKFTKWGVAEPVCKCDAATAVQFVKKLIFRFGYPHSIITNNGTNLSKGAMKELCQREHIRLDVSSVAHPQSNGQAERANQEILRGIKPRLIVPLKRTPGCWVEELPSVLWSINTTPNRSTGYTPFFMVYGAEAVLPCDIIHDSPRVRMYEEGEAELDRQDSLDALEEERDVAKARSAFYQQQARRYQSREVRAKTYTVGELVLRLPENKKDKLKPKWESPFIIDEVLTEGAYRLRDASDNRLELNPWNAARLRRFYA
jgi:hypothetical protein